MDQQILDHLNELGSLCDRFGVVSLDLFGSATGRGRRPFDDARSDYDFLVNLRRIPGMGPADQFFGLLEGLETLFGRQIHLVDESTLRNPYFRNSVNATREQLYATRGEKAAD